MNGNDGILGNFSAYLNFLRNLLSLKTALTRYGGVTKYWRALLRVASRRRSDFHDFVPLLANLQLHQT